MLSFVCKITGRLKLVFRFCRFGDHGLIHNCPVIISLKYFDVISQILFSLVNFFLLNFSEQHQSMHGRVLVLRVD